MSSLIKLLLRRQSDPGMLFAQAYLSRPRGYKTFFMLNSTEHIIYFVCILNLLAE